MSALRGQDGLGKVRTQPRMGTHLRLFFSTMNTSLCVPIKYVSDHAYHQSRYICAAAFGVVIERLSQC